MQHDEHQDPEQLQMEEQLADHRDYVFFKRVVHGIRQTQRKSPAAGLLFYENEQCLSHVVKMRQLQDPEEDAVDDDSSISNDDSHENDEDDDCIFHLEL